MMELALQNLAAANNIIHISPIAQEANKTAYYFYRAIINQACNMIDTGVFIVVPGFETSIPMLQALHESRMNICGIIVKNSTKGRNPNFEEKLLEAGYPILKISKFDLKKAKNHTLALLHEKASKYKKIVVLDHGGYFALHPEILNSFPKNLLIGICEYTLNGELRYALQPAQNRPIISVGQSPLKAASDQAAADLIVLLSDVYCKRSGLDLSDPKNKIGIIGHGRLGERICELLIKKCRVLIYDWDPSKVSRLPFDNVANYKSMILNECNIIFCATGNRALTDDDYLSLMNNAVLFTVTSPDDELDLEGVIQRNVLKFLPKKSFGDHFLYKIKKTTNQIILPFNGESPNTILEYGVVDPVIHQPCAAQIIAATRIFENKSKMPAGIHKISKIDENTVMTIWENYYTSYKKTKNNQMPKTFTNLKAEMFHV